jgi:molybdopterin-synthase adenylyltransferase
MTGARITLLGSQHAALTEFLGSHPDGHEKAAVVLFRRLHVPIEGLEDSDRYVAHHFIPFDDAWITGSSSSHVSFALAPLRDLFQKCEEDGLVFGFVHNHPGGLASFSGVDDENELTLLTALRNRNGANVSFVSMLWANRSWIARTRHASCPDVAIPARHTLVLGDRLYLYGYRQSSDDHSEVQARQAAAFGRPFVDMLQSLRVAVVGCGGTGSPLATLLARSGIGELVHIDKDYLAKSNLNRVRGLKSEDVGKNKARQLKGFIDSIGLSVKVAAYKSEVDADPAALDALASCDIVIGCTDDFAGRAAMNMALYVYAQLLIDVGLGGRVLEGSDGHPVLRYHYGRISSILPEAGQCLFCQDVVRDVWIRTQHARRENPNITEEELREKYLEDGGAAAPGVGPFTSASADFAVATLFDLIKPFRRFPPELRRDMYLVDFVTMQIRSYETEDNHDCPYCREHAFLLMKEAYRLNQPFLGERDEFY